jgi:predicted transcriptional regulator of viral defense system
MTKNNKRHTQETLHNWILKQNTVTNKEITAQFKNRADAKYVYIKYLNPLLRQGKIDRIRRGLYTAIDPLTGRPAADPVIVASKLRPEYYLGYHTALKIHGAAYSHRAQTHVCVKPRHRFREFQYEGNTYTPINTQDTGINIQTIDYRGHSVQVCGKERLLIECIDNPQHVGGWEQTMKSLEGLGGVDYERAVQLLEQKNSQTLTRKTGYILELLQQHSVFHRHLPKEALHRLETMVQGQPEYMEKGRPGPLNEKWMLYVSPRFADYLRGI